MVLRNLRFLSLSCILSLLAIAFFFDRKRPSIFKWPYGIELFNFFMLMTGQFSPTFFPIKNRMLQHWSYYFFVKKTTPPPFLTYLEFPDPPAFLILVGFNFFRKEMKGIVYPRTNSEVAGLFVYFFQFLKNYFNVSTLGNLEIFRGNRNAIRECSDWIVLVIGVLECWEVVSEKIILPPFGIPENCGPLERCFFLTSLDVGHVDCYCYWHSAPKEFPRFWFREI